MPDLDVYVESTKQFCASDFYTLAHVLRLAQRAGLSYRLLDRFDAGSSGKCAFLHVDLTELPGNFRQVHAAYPCSINGKATTINRKIYSKSILESCDDYRGPVISKTVLNHRGLPEFKYNRRRSFLYRADYKLRAILDRDYKQKLCPPYNVYDSMQSVPAEVWSDSRLIVEKFLPGSLELPITKFRYDFFFDCTLTTRSVFDSLLCDPAKIISVDTVSTVPEDVLEVRKRLNLDFGAIDYFKVANQAFVIDANKTVSTTEDWIEKFPTIQKYMDEITDCLIAKVRTV